MTRRFSTKARAFSKTAHRCEGGPWQSHTIYLAGDGDGSTAWLQIGTKVGRYRRGTWEGA